MAGCDRGPLILVVELGGPTMFARTGVMPGIEPRPRSRVQSVAEAASLGPPQAEERLAMTVWIYVDARSRLSPLV